MNELIESLKTCVDAQINAISRLKDKVNGNFLEVLEVIDNCKGRVIFFGVGKSGLIARKIASTLSSIGVASIFIHPTDAYHGDLGMLKSDDMAVFISNSGNTGELIDLMPAIKRMGLTTLAIVGNPDSELAKVCDLLIDVSIEKEASPVKLVPMASTTATLVAGDLIATGLIIKRGFKDEDFALLHPGGTIGKKLLTYASDLMHTEKNIPLVKLEDDFESILYEISSKRLGVAFVVNENYNLFGVITDGDLRRILQKHKQNVFNLKAKDMMTKNPKQINPNTLAINAANLMQQYSITSLAVVENEKIIGVIHIHDMLKSGVI